MIMQSSDLNRGFLGIQKQNLAFMQAEGGLNVLELKTNLQEACRHRREGIKKVAMLLCC